jgi:Ca2+-binding EF-hand superfamily protein
MAQQNKFTKEQIQEIYNRLRAMDKKDWDIDANKLGAELKDSNQSLDKMTNKPLLF